MKYVFQIMLIHPINIKYERCVICKQHYSTKNNMFYDYVLLVSSKKKAAAMKATLEKSGHEAYYYRVDVE